MKTTVLNHSLRTVPLAFLAMGSFSRAAEDPLPSWNDTPPKKEIIAFVEKVTKAGGTDFVPVPERIATFDNDGTLWAEQPMYFQLFFAIDRVKALAPKHPEWQTEEPFASLLKGDLKAALAGGEKALLDIVAATHAGMTTDQFEKAVTEWISTAKHPKSGKPFTGMVYQPMLELLAYLRAKGFKTYIVSGGGIEFMRPWAEKTYGIPPEQVVGSTGGLKYEVLADGTPVIVKTKELVLNDDKAGKPVGIQRHIGRRPIAAFGNSDGDFQMLEWTTAGKGARLGLIVHHTDAEREWSYDRESHIGRLDKGLDEATDKGWIIMDMKADWKIIYPTERNRTTMSAQITDASGGIITVEITGKISPEELAANQQLVLARLQEWGGGSILCICEEFAGWTDGDWSDLSFQEAADPLIRKMAVIGEREWEGLAMAFTAKGIRPFPIGYFETGRLEDARAWLRD